MAASMLVPSSVLAVRLKPCFHCQNGQNAITTVQNSKFIEELFYQFHDNTDKSVKEKLLDSPAYQHVRKQFREHSLTTEKLCRNKVEMEYLARTYLCYVQSVKQHEELHSSYKGAGERSVESAANLVGLKLPDQPKDND